MLHWRCYFTGCLECRRWILVTCSGCVAVVLFTQSVWLIVSRQSRCAACCLTVDIVMLWLHVAETIVLHCVEVSLQRWASTSTSFAGVRFVFNCSLMHNSIPLITFSLGFKGTLRRRLSYGYFSFIAKYASNWLMYHLSHPQIFTFKGAGPNFLAWCGEIWSMLW